MDLSFELVEKFGLIRVLREQNESLVWILNM